MMTDVYSVDTNILIYLHDKFNDAKRTKAKAILADNPKIAAQVISEYLNTARRLLDLSKDDLLIQAAELFQPCEIIPTSASTLFLAASLVKKYQFQIFDSVIVAASLQSNCSVLFSEDMHHGLVVNNTLTIVNPFV